MRRVVIAYSLIVAWLFGWLTATFGPFEAAAIAVVLGTPVLFAWRMLAENRPIKRREYVYLAVLAGTVVSAAAFLVVTWYSAGIDKLAMFRRELREFQRRIARDPECKNVTVDYTDRKGGRVYLTGTVPSKNAYDRLIKTINSLVHSNVSGYHDGVAYPGKPKLE